MQKLECNEIHTRYRRYLRSWYYSAYESSSGGTVLPDPLYVGLEDERRSCDDKKATHHRHVKWFSHLSPDRLANKEGIQEGL